MNTIELLKTKIRYCSETLRRFISKEYKWVIASIIAIPTSILAYQNIKFEGRSESFYYVPAFFSGNAGGLNEADCWMGSISTNRSDAFRCSWNNYILDPCFSDPISEESVPVITCPDSPTDRNSHQYKAKIDWKYRNDPKKNPEFNSPWYIIMHDGSSCQLIQGTSFSIADKRIDYSCVHGGKIAELSLPIKKKDGKLYISCFVDDRIIEDCLIKEAWY